MKSNEIVAVNGLTINEKENDITIAMICSVVEAFVRGLPYSIDPLSTRFVPVDILNAIPKDRESHWEFKNDDKEMSLFDKLKEWGDTRKTAYSIQLCFLLQALLINKDAKIPLVEDNDLLEVWGLSLEDGKKLKNSLKNLMPDRDKILNAPTIEEREVALLEAYESIQTNFGAWSPEKDLQMYYYFKQFDYKRYQLPKHESNYLTTTEPLEIESDNNPRFR